jgi:hypothetical protein
MGKLLHTGELSPKAEPRQPRPVMSSYNIPADCVFEDGEVRISARTAEQRPVIRLDLVGAAEAAVLLGIGRALGAAEKPRELPAAGRRFALRAGFGFAGRSRSTRRRSGGSARAAWGPETADPGEWKPANPSSCQCAITMLVVHDYLGGELLSADVFRGGERVDGLPSQSALFELLKAVDGACGCTKIDCDAEER